jgi:hypothetical protein
MVTPYVTPLGALPSAHPQTLPVGTLQLVGGPAAPEQAETTGGLYVLAPCADRAALAA